MEPQESPNSSSSLSRTFGPLRVQVRQTGRDHGRLGVSAGGLCKILNVSAGRGGHTGCFSGLCPGSPSQQGCGGDLPCRETLRGWPTPSVCRSPSLHPWPAPSLFPITPTGGNSWSGGTATPKPPGPAWPGHHRLRAPAPPVPLAQFPQVKAFPACSDLGPWWG